MSSPCFFDSIKLSLEKRNPKLDSAACWLCSNSVRSTKTEILSFNHATELVGYMLTFCLGTNNPQILIDTFNGLWNYLAVESERDRRIEMLLEHDIMNFCEGYITSANPTVLTMTLETIAVLSKYDGPKHELLCNKIIANQIIKVIKESYDEDQKSTAFEIAANLVAGTEKMRKMIIRNNTEMFKASINCLLATSSQLQLQVMKFLYTFLLVEPDTEFLMEVYDSNLDVGECKPVGARRHVAVGG